MFGDIMGILIGIMLAAVPLGILAGFIVSLVKFKKCPKENAAERKGYKFAAVVLGAVFGIMVLAFAVLLITLSVSIAYM
ncbi:MAG: hypothetical protein NC395_08955 [Prevotella sp.]|nr:hypothetical protein [Prevotella sp.]